MISSLQDAILWCRISDEKQADGYSLDAQEKHGREYCDRVGLKLIEEPIRIVETASKAGRRNKFENLLGKIIEYTKKKCCIIHLVVEKNDRLTRNFTSREKLQLLILEGKLVIHYFKESKIIDQNCSPSDIFHEDIQTAVSKYAALNIKRESIKGMREKASQGILPGRAPYGYLNVRDGKVGRNGRRESRIVPDLTMVPAIRRVFELRAIHKFSFQDIANTVVSERLVPASKAKSFSKSGVEGILYPLHLSFQVPKTSKLSVSNVDSSSRYFRM